MLKIGDFSKVAQVSVKTLRHYAKLGLLKPAWIDRFTGYRYYALDQLPRLNRILALRDLGFSLEQILHLLRSDLSADELRGMMQLRRAELERHIRVEQTRLTRIETRLRQIEREGLGAGYEVVVKSMPPQRVVGVRATVPAYDQVLDLFRQLDTLLRSHKIALDAAVPRLAIYYDAEYRERDADVEAAAPVAGPLPGASRLPVHELPGAESMACVVHQGGYERLPEAYNTLLAWTELNGYQIDGPNREVYLSGLEPTRTSTPAAETDALITEVQLPIRKKPFSIYLQYEKEPSEMEPKIITKPAFTVAGLYYQGKNENNEIAQVWQEFNRRFDEIRPMMVPGAACYGVCRGPDDSGELEYVAGCEVEQVVDLPQGLVSWEVPEQTYAVFPCTLKTLHDAYCHAYGTWLPQSGYRAGAGPDFEYYDDSFEPDQEDSLLHIYVPITR